MISGRANHYTTARFPCIHICHCVRVCVCVCVCVCVRVHVCVGIGIIATTGSGSFAIMCNCCHVFDQISVHPHAKIS